MISLFTGIPGAGKTYEAVVLIVANLSLGREVFTNIDGLNKPECLHVIKVLSGLDDFTLTHSLHFLDNKTEVPRFWEHINDGCLVLIDECHKFWNSRDFQKQGNRDLSDWAAEHRHLGIDVIFITQKPERLDTQVRSLANWVHDHRKLNFLGNLFNKLAYDYQVFIYEGEAVGRPMATKYRKYKKEFFKAYKSYVADDTKELQIMKAPNILNHWSIYACVVVLVVCGYFFSKSSFSRGKFLDYKMSAKVAPVPDSVAPAPIPEPIPEPVLVVSEPEPVLTDDILWLPVTAYIKKGTQQFVMVGKHRLSSWLEISDDMRYVLVNRSLIPSPVLRDVELLAAKI